MNILFFHVPGINPTGGGISQITHILATTFIAKGHSVYYLGQERKEGVEYTSFQYFIPNTEDLDCEENTDYIQTFCYDHRVDVIINQGGMSLPIVEFVAKVKGVKKVSVIHNSVFTQVRNVAFQREYGLKKKHLGILFHIMRWKPVRNMITNATIRKRRPMYQRIADLSDAVSIMSQGQADDLKLVINQKDWGKIKLIHNCIIPSNVSMEPREKVVLWVGTIDFSIKRIDLMLKIWKHVQNVHDDWTLMILGDSSMFNEAKNYAVSLGLKKVVFVGRVNPDKYYEKAQIACVTSTHESFSMVIIESFKYGLVPIAFDSFPAASELIENGNNGIVVRSFDINLYATRLCELIGDEIKLKLMRERSRLASENYIATNICDDWINMVRSI